VSGARRAWARSRSALARTACVLTLASLAAPAPAPASLNPQVCPPANSTPLSSPPPTVKSTTPAPPPPAPERVVVCIATQPITGAVLAHWTSVAEKAAGRRSSVAVAMQESMGFLISSDWVLGEARDLGISTSEREVRRSFDHIRAQQFHKRSEFHAFLRSSGETLADLVFRVRLNLTSLRIEHHFLSGSGSAKSKARALARFVAGFKSKWQAQTYCAAAYAVHDCMHVF
jgi:hypothetical protein